VKVLCAMSGGVDSSVAAAELLAAGHDVVGVTMRLWGGHSDTGCCSIADVDDARRVAQQLGIDHLVFNFTEDFDTHVVGPYVLAHQQGITPNPCIECNRHLKFDRLSERADMLGFDAIATGHHARVVEVDGARHVARGADPDKDQSYVVHMLPQRELARTLFPVGHLTKAEVRALAAAAGLRTASKPDSQDVCFISHTGGRVQFLGDRIPFRRGDVVDLDGRRLAGIESVELVTIGQRRGIGLPGGGPKRYVVDVDAERAVVVVGADEDLFDDEVSLDAMTWAVDPVADPVTGPIAGEVLVQSSAHGRTRRGVYADGVIRWAQPQRRIAPGQSVVLYDPTDTFVLGGGIARRVIRSTAR
jgi:tRNA-specific 2-thiouridylase